VAEVGRIQIEVDARDVDKAVKGLRDMGVAAQRAGGKVSKYEKDTKKATRATDKMSKSSKRLTRTFSFLGVGLGGLTFGSLARQIGTATTQLNNIEATMRVAAGSSEAAAEQLAFIREESERLGLFLPAVAKQMAQFSAAARGTSITGQELKTIFTGISEASRAMGLTAPETEGAMKALQQMMSKGKVSAEELRQQLGERMPGSIQIMAQSLGVGTQELFKMMENGELLSDEVLPKFGRQLQKVFGFEATKQANKLAASIDRLRTSFFDLMAQDQGLPGASLAINELAKAVGSSEFQKGFDTFVQMISKFMATVAKNLDHIVTLVKLLGATGLGLVAAQSVKILSSLVAVITSLTGRIIATNAATVSLIGNMTALSAVISRVAWPIAAVTAVASAIAIFTSNTKQAKAATKDWVNLLPSLNEDITKLGKDALEGIVSEGKSDIKELESIEARMQEIRNKIQSAKRGSFGQMGGPVQRSLEQELKTLRSLTRSYSGVREQTEKAERALFFYRMERLESNSVDKEAIKNIKDQSEAIRTLGNFNEEIASSLELADAATQVGKAFETLYPEDLEKRNKAITEFMENYVMQSEEAANNTKSLSQQVKDFQDKFGVIAEIDPQVSAAFELADQLARIKELNLSKERTISLEKQAMEAYRESNKEVDELEKNLGKIEIPMSKIERDAKEVADAIRGDLSNSITDVIMDVESLSDAFVALADQIARTMIQKQISDPIAEGLSGFATNAIGSLFGGGNPAATVAQGGSAAPPPSVRTDSGRFFQGLFANGGNVQKNRAAIVGERGPEMFVPGQDGRIIPNTEMGGGGDVTVNIINQGGERLEAQQQSSRRGPNGEQTVDVMVKSSIERLDGQGQLDGVFRRHGAARQGQF